MAKMKVNWKQLFVEKGERIGVGVAAFLSVLMIVPMIWYLFTGPSSQAISKELDTAATQLKTKQANATPTDADLPPPKKEEDKTNPTKRLERPIVDGSAYPPLEVLALEPQVDKTKRLRPNVLMPAEGRVAVALLQLRSFILSSDGTRIMRLEGDAPASPMGPMQSFDYKGYMDKLRSSGGRRGGGGPGAGRAPYNPHSPQEGAYGAVNMPMAKTDLKSRMMNIDDLGLENVHLADTVQPVRMAMIVAAFPYRSQIQEFKNKLHLKTEYDVVEETVSDDGTTTPDTTTPVLQPKVGKHTFYFVSPLVERRLVDVRGKPLPGADWTAVDLEGNFKDLLRWNGMRFEQEPFELDAIEFDGLSMPKLQAMEKNQWPDETKMDLKTLDASIKRIKDLNKPKVVKPKNPYDPKDFNPFSKQRFDAPNGTTPMPPPGIMPPVGASTDAEYPEYCMVRLIDVDIKPGQYYQYRIKVRMGNPNFGMKDKVASPNFATDDKPLEAAQWFEIHRKDETATQVVSVPPEYYLYPIDQQELEKKYDGQNKGVPVRDHESVFQIHKWLEETDAHQPIGEWSVAERVLAFRGEYIGRKERVKVPYWRPTMESFVLAVEANTSKIQPRNKDEGIWVDFGVPPTESRPATDYPILVDYDGGSMSYKHVVGKDDNGKEKYQTIPDTSGVEVLILTPDGKLVAKNSWSAKVDADRVKRLEDWRTRIKDVKDGKATGASNTGDGPDPFGEKKKMMP